MQGFFHLYIWSLIFLGLLALFNLKLLKPVALSILFAVLVGLPRLLPPALILSRITHEFMGGFATVTDLFSSLLVLRDPDRAMGFGLPSKTYPLSWWELDYFIGLLGFAVLVIFGVLLPLWRDRSRKSVHVQILFASLVMTALSIGNVFATIVRVVHVPPLTGERVTSRFFALPLVFVLVLAAIFLQRELDKRRFQPWVQLVILGACALVYHDLAQHLQAWRIRYLDGMTYLFPKAAFEASLHTITSRADPLYTGLLAGGAAVALLTLAVLAVLSARKARG